MDKINNIRRNIKIEDNIDNIDKNSQIVKKNKTKEILILGSIGININGLK